VALANNNTGLLKKKICDNCCVMSVNIDLTFQIRKNSESWQYFLIYFAFMLMQ
jgi:hypothetical protein